MLARDHCIKVRGGDATDPDVIIYDWGGGTKTKGCTRALLSTKGVKALAFVTEHAQAQVRAQVQEQAQQLLSQSRPFRFASEEEEAGSTLKGRLRAFRRRNGYTQAQTGQLMGFSATQISYWFNDVRLPPGKVATMDERVAELLEADLAGAGSSLAILRVAFAGSGSSACGSSACGSSAGGGGSAGGGDSAGGSDGPGPSSPQQHSAPAPVQAQVQAQVQVQQQAVQQAEQQAQQQAEQQAEQERQRQERERHEKERQDRQKANAKLMATAVVIAKERERQDREQQKQAQVAQARMLEQARVLSAASEAEQFQQLLEEGMFDILIDAD